jgi:DNA modification methylase
MEISLYCDDCLSILPYIPSESVDAVITDPPYPYIKRDYGMLTEEQWWDLMMGVCKEVRRILKPSGSAVFILQANAKKLGNMRGWLWEFMAWVCREWNMVQDAWWWNYATIPSSQSIQGRFMRPSVKACVWAGSPSCYHNQDLVLVIPPKATDYCNRFSMSRPGRKSASGHHHSPNIHSKSIERNGSSPFNLIPVTSGGGASTHGAGTPLELVKWWARFICPIGGTILDPFVGYGTTMLAALNYECTGIGIDKMLKYIDITEKRCNEWNK